MRLALANPEDLRRGETGQRRVAGHIDELASAAGGAFEVAALGDGALVVPEDGRPQGRRVLGPVVRQQHQPVHLTAQADARDGRAFDLRLADDLARRLARGGPPLLRILLRPARLRRADVMLRRGRGPHASAAIADQCLRARCPNVDAQQIRHGAALSRQRRTRPKRLPILPAAATYGVQGEGKRSVERSEHGFTVRRRLGQASRQCSTPTLRGGPWPPTQHRACQSTDQQIHGLANQDWWGWKAAS